MNDSNLPALEQQLVAWAREAGKVALDRADDEGALRFKPGREAVTDADTEIETLLRSERQRLAGGSEAAPRLELAEVGARIAATVDVYNESHGRERVAAARRLRVLERRLRHVRRGLDRSTRGCSILQHALAVHLRRAGIEVTGRGASVAA